jgi:hypothetical protein
MIIISRPDPAMPAPAREFLVWCADDCTEAFVLRDELRRLGPPASAEDERAKALATLNQCLSLPAHG